MRIIEVNPEAIGPIEAKILANLSEVKIYVVEINTVKTCTKANIRATAIKVIITKAIMVYIITHIEIINKVITMANLEAEAVVMAQVISVDIVMVGLIIEAITITKTISDDEYQTDQCGPPCALCGGYNHSPKHCFKGEHDINDVMEKMNISGYQSQSSGLYS